MSCLFAVFMLLSRFPVAVRTRRRRNGPMVRPRGWLFRRRRLHGSGRRGWCRGIQYSFLASSFALYLGTKQGLILDELLVIVCTTFGSFFQDSLEVVHIELEKTGGERFSNNDGHTFINNN